MRLNEFIDEQQLVQLQNILGNTIQAISKLAEIQVKQNPPTCQPKPQTKNIPRAKSTPKNKVVLKSKKAPYAIAPKPLPKPKPLTPPTQQYSTPQRNLSTKASAKPMPRSYKPLSTNIISPIGGGDTELNKKFDQARQQGEQNRAFGSEPHSFSKN